MIRLLFVTLLLFATPSWAQDHMLFELAKDRVDITTGFDGTSIVAFGTFGDSDNVLLAITIKGPETTMVVRQKERGITGVWGNKEAVEFRRVLQYYDYAVFAKGKDEADINAVLINAKIDVDNLEFYPEDDMDEVELEPYRDALIRSLRTKGFYPIKPTDINFYGGNLFKTTFVLPPGVPTGTYTVEASVFKDAELLEYKARSLQVGQVGFNARVYIYATEYAFLYGLLAVLLAVILGWSAFTFLRRD